MIKFDEHLNESKETKRQILRTNSNKRKRYLERHLYKLRKEYKIAKEFYEKGK